jgi:AmiR/NasT family two-component response regulator
MRSRAVIEQAKGILMAARRLTADEAFQVLVQLSQTRNVKLREIAARVVSQASGHEVHVDES